MIQALEHNPTALIVTANREKGHLALFRNQLFGEILSLKSTQSLANFIQAHTAGLVTV
jgi:hypothetical protein